MQLNRSLYDTLLYLTAEHYTCIQFKAMSFIENKYEKVVSLAIRYILIFDLKVILCTTYEYES